MRLIDLAQPYLGGIHTIVEIAAGDLDLRPYLRDAGDAAYVRCDPGGDIPAVGKGVLLMLATGPDPAWHLPPEVCGQILGQVTDGGRGLVLFGYRGAELPYHQILDSLVARRCQVLQAASLDYPDLPCGIAFAHAGDVQAPPDYFGRRVSAGDVWIRIANEHVLAGFVWRGLRARYQDLERAAGAAPPDRAGLAADNERLARALSDAEQRLGRAEKRLTAVERSATMEVGRLFVTAARRPWRGALRLPRELHAVARRRRGGGGPGQARVGAEAEVPPARAPHHRLFAAAAAPALGWRPAEAGKLVITGLLTARTCATLEPDAAVHPLLPHDAALALEGTGADIMIIDAAAALPGGPWSYIGDPAAADRGRRLADLIAVARSLGIPVVFLRTLPPQRAPGLEVVAARCDAAYEGDLGVQLARFNPVDLDPLRPCDAIYAGRIDPREPPVERRLLDALDLTCAGVRTVVDIPWQAEPCCYRRHGLFVTTSPRQAREQLACGARVVGPVGAAEPVAGAVHLPDAGAAAAAIAAAREQGARQPSEIRGVLRELFTRHATPVRLAGLATLAGVTADPLASRQVAVLAVLPASAWADPASRDATAEAWEAAAERCAGRLAAGVLRQRHRPGEVVLAPPETARGGPVPGQNARRDYAGAFPGRVPSGLRELKDAGIAVRMAREPGLAGAARTARCGWVAPWDAAREYPDTHLLDLVCARELSRADAVGAAHDSTGHGYVFAPDLAPALARRELLSSGGAGDLLHRSGHRLFTISGRH